MERSSQGLCDTRKSFSGNATGLPVRALDMLITEDRHECPPLPFVAEAGTKVWRLVSLELRRAVFFVSHASLDGRAWLSQAALLWRDDDILAICREAQSDSTRRIHQISMLIPDAAHQWRMTSIHEIWTGMDARGPLPVLICVEPDGRRICISLPAIEEGHLLLDERVYPPVKAPPPGRRKNRFETIKPDSTFDNCAFQGE